MSYCSPRKLKDLTWEEKFKISELEAARSAKSNAETSPRKLKRKMLKVSSRVLVRMNIGLGSPSKLKNGAAEESNRSAHIVNLNETTADVMFDDGEESFSVPIEFIDLMEVDHLTLNPCNYIFDISIKSS